VADVTLEPGVVAQVGESAEIGRRRAQQAETDWLLLLDEHEAPLGWIRPSRLDAQTTGTLSPEDVDASSPLVHHDTTLRDALSMLLTSAVQTAVVVDDRGRFLGVLTVDQLGMAFRSDATPEAAGVP
jgi:osmoprotectant transport system ATP-binding protein